MFFIISVNGTMHISVSHSVAYVLIETSIVLKTFLYTVCLNLCPVVQRCIGIILFLIIFLSVTVKIQSQNIFILYR